ncbi:hypothetical protein FKM82_025212 [Ascaphus truei]
MLIITDLHWFSRPFTGSSVLHRLCVEFNSSEPKAAITVRVKDIWHNIPRLPVLLILLFRLTSTYCHRFHCPQSVCWFAG